MHAALVRAALIVAAAGAVAVAQPIPPAPTRWVTDDAGFLSPGTRAALDQKLESYQQTTGHQVIVWVGKTLGPGAALDDWATRTFAAWKVGRAKLDDGIAMFVLADDRKIDIEVGYGLEDKVPDAIASRIIRDVMAPKLRAGDRDGAVTAGTDALLASIEGKPYVATGVTGTGVQPAPRRPLSTGEKILAVIGLVALVIFCITHPRLALFLLWSIMARGGGGGGGGNGGGFGGGGGRSGGGGARGGW